MYSAKLSDMVRGWFIGDFSPSLLRTEAVEVAVKNYTAGDRAETHYHKVATEYTVVISGRIKMFGSEWKSGDIIVVEPNEWSDFVALTDSTTVVVKLPGEKNDKYTLKS